MNGNQFWISRFVIVFGMVISGIIAVVVIVVPLIAPFFTTYQIPKIIEEWGGIIIGFYFGTFATLITNLLVEEKRGGQPAPGSGTPGTTD